MVDKFECEKCGKSFSHEDDALKHEKSCSIKKADNEIIPFSDLNKGEKIEFSFHPSHLAYLHLYIIGGILCLSFFFIIIGIPIILVAYYSRKGKKYYITNQRIILDYKFINKSFSNINYNRIQDIHLNQGLMQRLFNIGTISVNTAGSSSMELEISNINNPEKVKKLISKNLHVSSKANKHSIDHLGEIEKLHSLMKKGIITKKDFETKKKKLLK